MTHALLQGVAELCIVPRIPMSSSLRWNMILETAHIRTCDFIHDRNLVLQFSIQHYLLCVMEDTLSSFWTGTIAHFKPKA